MIKKIKELIKFIKSLKYKNYSAIAVIKYIWEGFKYKKLLMNVTQKIAEQCGLEINLYVKVFDRKGCYYKPNGDRIVLSLSQISELTRRDIFFNERGFKRDRAIIVYITQVLLHEIAHARQFSKFGFMTEFRYRTFLDIFTMHHEKPMEKSADRYARRYLTKVLKAEGILI